MNRVKLGQNGPLVSVIGFGAWAIGGMNWGPQDDEVSRQALRSALDGGVDCIDTADVYGFGHSEDLIAGVLRERGAAGKVTVATKAGNDFTNATAKDDAGYGPIRQTYTKEYLVWAAEQSLRRLGVERLDILQLHSPDTATLEKDEPWEALATLKRDGKIRLAGLSVQSFRETEQAHLLARHAGLLDVVQVRYNLLEREAAKVLLPEAQRHEVGVIVRIPLLFGLLTGKFTRDSEFTGDDHRKMNLNSEKLDGYLVRLEKLGPLFERFPGQSMAQVSLRFCVTHPACHTVIPGMRSPGQVADNTGAGSLGPLDDESIKLIESV